MCVCIDIYICVFLVCLLFSCDNGLRADAGVLGLASLSASAKEAEEISTLVDLFDEGVAAAYIFLPPYSP